MVDLRYTDAGSRPAFSSASVSPCLMALPSCARRLCPTPRMVPSSATSAPPIGTPPSSRPMRACSMAWARCSWSRCNIGVLAPNITVDVHIPSTVVEWEGRAMWYPVQDQAIGLLATGPGDSQQAREDRTRTSSPPSADDLEDWEQHFYTLTETGAAKLGFTV